MLANKARETALKIQKSVLWAKRKMSLYPMALCVRTTVGRGIWGEEMDQTMQGFRAAWLLALLFCGQLCPSRALGSKTFLGLRRERRSYESLHKYPARSHASVVYLIWLGWSTFVSGSGIHFTTESCRYARPFKKGLLSEWLMPGDRILSLRVVTIMLPNIFSLYSGPAALPSRAYFSTS